KNSSAPTPLVPRKIAGAMRARNGRSYGGSTSANRSVVHYVPCVRARGTTGDTARRRRGECHHLSPECHHLSLVGVSPKSKFLLLLILKDTPAIPRGTSGDTAGRLGESPGAAVMRLKHSYAARVSCAPNGRPAKKCTLWPQTSMLNLWPYKTSSTS